MTIRLSRPEGLLEQDDYAPVAVASGSRFMLLAGQAGVTPAGAPASDDLAGQVEAAMGNIAAGVRGAGGTPDDVARLTVYVVRWEQEMASALFHGLTRAQEAHGFRTPLPPLTVIGVHSLWTPQLLVEIEATAVLG